MGAHWMVEFVAGSRDSNQAYSLPKLVVPSLYRLSYPCCLHAGITSSVQSHGSIIVKLSLYQAVEAYRVVRC
jgi:hypothetical protein